MTTAVLFAALTLAAADPQAQDSPPATPPAQSAKPPAKPPTAGTAVSGVTVNGAAQAPVVQSAIDRRSYTVANDLQAKTGSIGDVLRNIPSVQVDIQGNLSLRGDPNVTILVDGKPSSQFSNGNQALALQALPADQIDRIEVITNPSAEFRADGSGGIINLITKKAKGAGTTGSVRVQAGTGDRAILGGTAGYNSNKLSVTADVTYQKLTQIQSSLEQQGLTGSSAANASLDNTDTHTTQSVAQGHVGADYDLSAKTRVTGSLRYVYVRVVGDSEDTFVQNGNTGSPVNGFDRESQQFVTQQNGEASVILRHKYADGNDLTLNATYNGNQTVIDRIDDITPTLGAGSASSDEVYRVNFNRRSMVTADYERPLGTAKLKLGLDFEYNDNFVEHHGGFGIPGGPISPASAQTDNFADVETHNQAYVTYEQPFGKLDALFGLRGETVHLALDQVIPAAKVPSQDYNRLYPTLHLAYDLGAGKRLTASYSKRVVRPQPIDLDPFRYTQSPTAAVQGNPDLMPQDTDSYELGFEDRKGPANFLATLYYRQTNNAFTFAFSDLGSGVLLQERENAGYQANGGLELVYVNKLTSKLTYNLSADGYWSEISAPSLTAPVVIQTQSTFTGFGRANLNYQVTPKDFLQVNLFVNGKALVPQGYIDPTVSGNIGYRHTINNKVSWMFVVQDPFKTLKNKLVLGALDRRTLEANSRVATLTLVWNFSGKPQPQNFDFAPGGGAGALP
jgi:outer membrane receptor protein involved in Fe transport